MTPLLAFFRALHPFPSLLVSGIVLMLIPIADPGASALLYLQLGAGMLCYQFAIGLVNDLVDARDDVIAKPWKPIASGVVSTKAATWGAVALVIIGATVTLALPFAAWLVGMMGLACGLGYDLWLKRTRWSWLPFAIALPLVPTWVWSATDQWDARRGWVLPLGALLGLSVHLANQSPDIVDDRLLGVQGLAQRIGERSRILSIALFALTACSAAIVLVRESPVVAAMAVGIGIVATSLTSLAPRLFGRDGLFGVLAVASGALAVVYLGVA